MSATARRIAWMVAFLMFAVVSVGIAPAMPSATAAVWGGVGAAHDAHGGATTGHNQLTSAYGRLSANNYVPSDNDMYVLIMQTDGNLVLYGNGVAMWWSWTFNRKEDLGPNFANLGFDGDMSVRRWDNTLLWSSHTAGKGSSHAVVQDDGNFAIYTDSGNQLTWNTRTGGHPTYKHLVTSYGGEVLPGQPPVGTRLFPNYYLRSQQGDHALLFQPDGNVVLYGPGYHVLWSWGSNGTGANQLVMQADGNLVLYRNNGTWVRNTGTGGKGPSAAVIGDDGNFVVYKWPAGSALWDRNQWTWATWTQGRT